MENKAPRMLPQSRLRPPMVAASLKTQTSQDNIPHAQPRRMLSRRSQSMSDLRHNPPSRVFAPFQFKKQAAPSSKVTTTFCRPVPTFTKQATKPVVKTGGFGSGSTSNMGIGANLRKRAVADSKVTNAGAATAPKVAKPMKPAPYDFKARYNLLKEKFVRLQENNKELGERVDEVENEKTLLKDEMQQVKSENANLTDKLGKSNTEIQNLTEIVSSTSTQLKLKSEQCDTYKERLAEQIRLNKELEDVKMKNVSLQATFKINCAQIADLTIELKNSQETIDELNKVITTHLHRIYDGETVRRSLHNKIQDLKGQIRVFCRVRPCLESESDRMPININFINENMFELIKMKESISSRAGDLSGSRMEFSFDQVFAPSNTQEEVFEELSHLIQSALDGYNICVFAYGQTGSGKTYTMQGDGNDLGMIPRSAQLLFKKITELEAIGWKYSVSASFLEIYNESVRDLLDITSTKQIDIRFNKGQGVTITNLVEEKVDSATKLLMLMRNAQHNRVVASTNFNEHSSRSHAVTMISISGSCKETIYNGLLNLVDLAGSENPKQSERMKETKSINKSLSALGNVILALNNHDDHVPYRDSKLTYLLQSSLGGNSKTLMFVNISPIEDCLSETLNSLRFATNVKQIKLKTSRNKCYKV